MEKPSAVSKYAERRKRVTRSCRYLPPLTDLIVNHTVNTAICIDEATIHFLETMSCERSAKRMYLNSTTIHFQIEGPEHF
jgi:hypothetical protein